MQSRNPFNPPLQTFLSFTPPTQPLTHYPYPNFQIQNLPNFELKFPIIKSNDFTVEVTEKNGEKKKYRLEDLAKIVPDNFMGGVLNPEIKDDKLKISINEKIESYPNKILIKTGVDYYVVIPNRLIDKAREEAERLKMEKAKKKAREEAKRLKMEEAKKKAREEAKRLKMEEAKKKAREEALKKAQEAEIKSCENPTFWGRVINDRNKSEDTDYATEDEPEDKKTDGPPQGFVPDPKGTLRFSNNGVTI
jgi:hypothetical protein